MITAPTTAAPRRPTAIEDEKPLIVRKAWRILIGSFLVFTLLLAGAGVGIGSYLWSATRPLTGTVEHITGSTQASVRPRQQIGFKVLNEGDTVDEGDTVRTPRDSRVTIRLFNQTVVELSGGSEVVFEQLRTQQYVNRRATIILKQTKGRVIVSTSTITGFAATTMEVRTNSGGVEARQPGTQFRVFVMPGDDDGRETTNVSVLGGGAVIVAGTGAVQETVALANGQQSVVVAGVAPTAPTTHVRDLLIGGNFPYADADDILKAGSHWADIANDGNDGRGVARGRAEIVTELVRGQPTRTLRFARDGGNTDNEQVGFRQAFAFGELDEYDAVNLTVDVKVVNHSLSAGGEQGSEYPVIVLLRYKDANGDAKDVGHAFYTQNDRGYNTRNSTTTGFPVQPGVWTPHTWDLKSLVPAPYRLVQMDVYASGHDFDAYVANLAIVAK